MKKIFIGKNDDPAQVVENILSEVEKSIVLVIPKFSKVSDSVANFHLLKREAEADGKNLLVESIDDDALALAAAAKIPGVNPFLFGRKHSMSDIVPPSATSATDVSAPDAPASSIADENVTVASTPNASPSGDVEVDFTAKDEAKRRRLSGLFSRRLVRIAVGGAVVAPMLWAAASYSIPAVTVNLTLKTFDWNFSEPVTAVVGLSTADYAARRFPAEIFSDKKSVSVSQPATGERKIERRATGAVTIYNAFSSAAQPLVSNTRLLTPEGLLFRLSEKVTVPGAKIEQGKIIPSSISASVTADQAGDKYNLGPVSRFSIPGFQGTSKYEGFYAASSDPMVNGFVGTVAYPVKADLDAAIAKLEPLLSDAGALSLHSLPAGFVVVDGASKINNRDPKVDDTATDSKNFTVLGETSISVISFPADELELLLKFAAADNLGFAVDLNNLEISYSSVSADFSANTLRFTPSVRGGATRAIDVDTLKNEIAGLGADALKDYIVGLPGVESARISFWPFWVDKVPSAADKIKVVIGY